MKPHATESGRRITFALSLAASRSEVNRTLFRKAAVASRLAKATRGRTQKLLYQIKHRAMTALIERGRVVVRHDVDRFPGLLSVEIEPHVRLHTHEAWLEAARVQKQPA